MRFAAHPEDRSLDRLAVLVDLPLHQVRTQFGTGYKLAVQHVVNCGPMGGYVDQDAFWKQNKNVRFIYKEKSNLISKTMKKFSYII